MITTVIKESEIQWKRKTKFPVVKKRKIEQFPRTRKMPVFINVSVMVLTCNFMNLSTTTFPILLSGGGEDWKWHIFSQ